MTTVWEWVQGQKLYAPLGVGNMVQEIARLCGAEHEQQHMQ